MLPQGRFDPLLLDHAPDRIDQQRELADVLEVDPTYISHLEKDRRDPSVRFLRRFASANRIPSASLLVVALWSELDPTQREAFRPLLSSIVRLTAAVGQHEAD